jgi:hypothetical protein
VRLCDLVTRRPLPLDQLGALGLGPSGCGYGCICAPVPSTDAHERERGKNPQP